MVLVRLELLQREQLVFYQSKGSIKYLLMFVSPCSCLMRAYQVEKLSFVCGRSRTTRNYLREGVYSGMSTSTLPNF